MKTRFAFLIVAAIVACGPHIAAAQSPQLINFQAQIEGLTSSVAAVSFAIFDASAGGNELWTESYPNLPIQNGAIQVLLGSNRPIPESVFSTDGERYIAISVNGENLTPRSRIASVGYAVRAAVADRVEGAVAGGVTSLNGLSGTVTLEQGSNVTITPDGQNIRIDAGGGNGGGNFTTITGGNGINVSDTDGPTAEISLENQIKLGPNGRVDIADGSNRTMATLEVQSGGHGTITANNTQGVKGARMWGDLTSSGLFGGSMATFKRDGDNASMWIRTEGSSAGNAWGVFSLYNSANDPAIEMDAQNGNVSIAGNLSKGSGSFKIDHPLDPANKYLSHSFVESPDMMNIYNGNVELDEDGEAWVDLPEWFGALNRDFRYQLTCIGGQALVYVAEEISNNRFKIAGGTQGLKVSWQVTGVRQDPYAETHRIQVEEDKPADKRGSYLHPDAYGLSRQ